MNFMNMVSGWRAVLEKKKVFFLEWVRLGVFYVHFGSLSS